MLGSSIQRVYWPLALAAALGLVFGASSAQAVNKNPGDPFSVGIVNSINQTSYLSGTSQGAQLDVSNASPSGVGLEATSLGVGGAGVIGQSLGGVGVRGSTFLERGNGVEGVSVAGLGVSGQSDTGTGVAGKHLGRDGDAAGVEGDTFSSARGAVGVLGRVNSTTAGFNSAGVKGDTASTMDGAVGVLGQVTSTTPGSGSVAVRGINNGTGANGVGVYGSQSGSGRGVFGFSPNGRGVYGFSGGGVGVYGESSAGTGVVADSSTGTGIRASSSTGRAGSFRGNVYVNGQLTVDGSSFVIGDLNVGGVKLFRIDDPLDPKRKYLVHASVESNQVLNIYSGNITTDRHGTATVRLPAYFDRINTDLRYQLTVVGQFAQAIVAEKEAGNRFVIRTDKPRVEVSWEVTARRNDAYLRTHPFHEIQTKTKADKDLTVLLHGKPGAQSPRP